MGLIFVIRKWVGKIGKGKWGCGEFIYIKRNLREIVVYGNVWKLFRFCFK